jgi:hypothetical protein
MADGSQNSVMSGCLKGGWNVKAEEAAQLQAEWKAKGDPECLHPFLCIESSSKGYLRGSYICRLCGKTMKVEQQSPIRA